MLTCYTSYHTEIKNVKYIAGDGRVFPRTIHITLFNASGKEVGSHSFGWTEAEDIYRMIREGKPVNLDQCFIRDFSLSDYRQKYHLDKKEPVRFAGFTARNAFFEASENNDFSYSFFPEGGISFEGSHFAKGKVFFNNSKFGDGNVNFSNTAFIDGHVEFRGSTFGNGDFIFKNAVINNGIKDFQDIKFGNGETSFANTDFNHGELLFINSHFGDGNFNFKVARINGGKVDFHYCAFGDGEVAFERAEFGNSRVDFRAVDFGSGRTNFNRAVFGNGEIDFEGAYCKSGKIQFKKAKMGSGLKNFGLMRMNETEMNFDRTDFGKGDVIFNNSRIKILSLRSCHLDHYFDLRLADAELLNISDTIVRDIIDLIPYESDVRIRIIDFSGMRLIGKLYIDWKGNNCSEVIVRQDEKTYRKKAEQFRILKENFSATGQYEEEDEAYIMFKRYEAMADREERISRNKWAVWWANPVYAFKWLVYDKIGLFATSPARVLISVILFWILFGILYYLVDLSGLGTTFSSVGNPDELSPLIQSFYHSAITFFTIGYGDVFPQGLSRIISGLEGFIGVFMMSYFTVAFVRKVLR